MYSNVAAAGSWDGATLTKVAIGTRHVFGGLGALQDSKIREFDHFGKKLAKGTSLSA